MFTAPIARALASTPLESEIRDILYDEAMHGADYDIRILDRDYGASVRGLEDTQIMAQLLGEPKTGLAALLEADQTTEAGIEEQRRRVALLDDVVQELERQGELEKALREPSDPGLSRVRRKARARPGRCGRSRRRSKGSTGEARSESGRPSTKTRNRPG